MGFEINLYDKFVENKMIDGKQFAISLHVDDNKISHVKAGVLTDIMGVLQKFFGEFTVTRGKTHS